MFDNDSLTKVRSKKNALVPIYAFDSCQDIYSYNNS